MNSNRLEAVLPFLMPRAISWAESVASIVAQRGAPLNPSDAEDASSVGVREVDKIRVLMVDFFPFPDDPDLRAAAVETGLLDSNTTGLTLGYSILIRKGHLSRCVLSHECRHVAQYEHAGGIASFLPVYLGTIVQPGVGYWNSPFEVEARQYELK